MAESAYDKLEKFANEQLGNLPRVFRGTITISEFEGETSINTGIGFPACVDIYDSEGNRVTHLLEIRQTGGTFTIDGSGLQEGEGNEGEIGEGIGNDEYSIVVVGL